MNAAFHSLIAWIQPWMAQVRARYGVSPVLFLALTVLCAPFFYYSIFRLIKAGVKRDKKALTLWSTVFLVATVLPYLYVLFFGHGLPWYVYLILAVLIVQSGWSLIQRLRASRAPVYPGNTGAHP
jgi:hypothetical protein